LVRTGVFQGDTTPGFPPRATVDSVLDAVKHGMTEEYRNAAMNASAAVVVIEEWFPFFLILASWVQPRLQSQLIDITFAFHWHFDKMFTIPLYRIEMGVRV
jgi:hypothetical protein